MEVARRPITRRVALSTIGMLLLLPTVAGCATAKPSTEAVTGEWHHAVPAYDEVSGAPGSLSLNPGSTFTITDFPSRVFMVKGKNDRFPNTDALLSGEGRWTISDQRSGWAFPIIQLAFSKIAGKDSSDHLNLLVDGQGPSMNVFFIIDDVDQMQYIYEKPKQQ